MPNQKGGKAVNFIVIVCIHRQAPFNCIPAYAGIRRYMIADGWTEPLWRLPHRQFIHDKTERHNGLTRPEETGISAGGKYVLQYADSHRYVGSLSEAERKLLCLTYVK